MTNAGRQPRAQSRGNDLRAGGEGRAGGPAAGYGRSTQPRGAAFHARMKKYADGGGVTDPLAGMSPVDLARLRAELAAKPREMTVDERWRNYATTGADVAGSLPVIGNAMSAYDAYQGGKGAVDAAQAGDVRGAALNTAVAGLGALGAVSGIPWSRTAGEVARDARSTARIFAGPKAKTANTVALAKAQSMQGAGADPADIWRETGWFRGKDGGWRFEIDDSGAKLGRLTNAERNLSEKLVHPELYAAYPDAANIRISQGDIGGYAAQYIRRSGRDEITVSREKLPDRLEHTLHEIQHAIQRNERFHPGGDLTGTAEGQQFLYDKSNELYEKLINDPMNVDVPGHHLLGKARREIYQKYVPDYYVIWDDSIIGPPTKEPYANGGTAARVGEYMRGGRVTVGAVEGATGGRTDALAVDVPEGAYVIPADVVAALGEGNTTAGMRQLEQQFGRPRHASGGRVVPIMVSDGEFVVSPEHVEAVGGADVLDRFVTQRRRAYADQLARMPGPKQ